VQGIDKWAEEYPDLVVVDSHAWQMEDIEFCRKLRAETVIPILLFTSQNDEYYLLEAYKAGVDECVPQPVSPRIFSAKVHAWLRHVRAMPSLAIENLEIGDLRLDPERRILWLAGGDAVRLTYLEMRLLYQLMSRPGQVIENSALVEGVWGRYGEGDGALLKNLVYRMRKKFEPDPARPKYLLTEGNIGYSFRRK